MLVTKTTEEKNILYARDFHRPSNVELLEVLLYYDNLKKEGAIELPMTAAVGVLISSSSWVFE